MKSSTDMLDLSVFPEEVKRQITDFYQFLKARYIDKPQSGKPSGTAPSSRLPETFYKPIRVSKRLPFDREEIYREK